MAKRSKRLKSAIESLKAQIEEHFIKLEKDIQENEIDGGRYHSKEIEKSFIATLERKINLLGANAEDIELIKRYKALLEEYKRKL